MISLLLMTIGNGSMWVVAVVLPEVQKDFGVGRAEAALPYTLMMIGFGVGGIFMGRFADRFGMLGPLIVGACATGLGFVLAGLSQGILGFALAHGLLIGLLGSSATFAPLMRRRAPAQRIVLAVPGQRLASDHPFGLKPNTATALLCVAGVACCVAMSMPQVHIVAYCSDLGYGAARGAEMLSLMLACGIVSRLVSGAICDRIGGLRTLLLGSVLQGLALLMFLPFDGLVSLYIVAALFGLFQGGIVPAYAIIVREYFAPNETGVRVGAVIMSTMLGMALGGWMSGKVFDLTGSYDAAFLNGVAWNLLNLAIAGTLFWRVRRLAAKPAG